MKKVITGNEAVSYGAMLSRVDVIAAYPITPQTSIAEKLSEFCGSGQLDAEYLRVESEHSAMASCIGAASTGVRSFTATSSQGLGLMHELLHWATGARLPIVLANINRAFGAPWSIWCDQNDSLSQRDTGWLQFYSQSCQEALDSVILAYRISEEVLLPAMVMLDGFFLSHTSEIADIPKSELVDKFLPKKTRDYRLDVESPCTFSGGTTPDLFMEFKYKVQQAMERSLDAVERAYQDFELIFNRRYRTIEPYKLNDAELALISLGTISSTARIAVDRMRAEGKPVGMINLRMFRPFPKEEIIKALKGVKRIAVIDRNISYGQEGIISQELKSVLFPSREDLSIYGFITGLGGRDVSVEDVIEIAKYAFSSNQSAESIIWIKLKK